MSCTISHRKNKNFFFLTKLRISSIFIFIKFRTIKKEKVSSACNTERKGQYTGWVEGGALLGLIHNYCWI